MAGNLQVVLFELGTNLCALPVESVREILRVPAVDTAAEKPADAPDSPAWHGTAVVRGRTVTMWIGSTLAGIPSAAGVGAESRMLMIGEQDGIIADQIQGIEYIDPDAVASMKIPGKNGPHDVRVVQDQGRAIWVMSVADVERMCAEAEGNGL